MSFRLSIGKTFIPKIVKVVCKNHSWEGDRKWTKQMRQRVEASDTKNEHTQTTKRERASTNPQYALSVSLKSKQTEVTLLLKCL